MEATETTPKIRPMYQPVALAKLDQRTKEARLMRETRAELVAHVGGKPSAVQSAMIERAVQLTLRIADMDAKFTETGVMSDFASRTYLAWSNSLTRTLNLLGVNGAPAARGDPTIGDLLAMPSRPVQPARRVAVADDPENQPSGLLKAVAGK